jgi:hypothetical protein
MKSYYYILLILAHFSCEKKMENPLIGNWYFDKHLITDDTSEKENFSLNIINDSVLEYKFGFYEEVPTKMEVLHFDRDTTDMEINALRFLGTKTKYKVKDSTLSFWDLGDSIWIKHKIKTLNHDNLILEKENKEKFNLVKKRNIHYNSNLYDAIIIDRDYLGLGLTGINTTYINREGKIYFKGLGYNTNEEDFVGQLDLNITTQIFKKFDIIDLLKMNDNYPCETPDSQNNSITFLKNGKIIKTIQDCSRKAPIDFYVAYNELSYLYQKIKQKNNYSFIFDNRLHFSSFENKVIKHKVYNSELFLLDLELRKGKEVNISFNPKFNLIFSYGNQGFLFSKIETDSRYYKFYYNDNTTKTIDIGYNFIEANPILLTKNRTKPSY